MNTETRLARTRNMEIWMDPIRSLYFLGGYELGRSRSRRGKWVLFRLLMDFSCQFVPRIQINRRRSFVVRSWEDVLLQCALCSLLCIVSTVSVFTPYT